METKGRHKSSASDIVNSDGTITVVGGRFSADELTAKMDRLAEQRAGMEPPVPDTCTLENLGVVTDPSIYMRRASDDMLVMALRHSGFGWCGFEFSEQAAATLRDALIAHVSAPASYVLSGADEPNMPKH